jgi:hypothetical protein
MNELTRDAFNDFIRDVNTRVPLAFRNVDFARILSDIISWSLSQRSVVPGLRGDQNTVSFCLRDGCAVVWAAYPRNIDGAKIVILPGLSRHLRRKDRTLLLDGVRAIASNETIQRNGLLQIPMHVLSDGRRLRQFEDLLALAIRIAERHQLQAPA